MDIFELDDCKYQGLPQQLFDIILLKSCMPILDLKGKGHKSSDIGKAAR